MDPISVGLSISAIAQHVWRQIDWEKAASGYAKDAASAGEKALWKRLKPSERDKAAKLAVALFIEQFNTELEDKTPLSSSLDGYRDQLKRLVEAAYFDISNWMQPDVTEVDLDSVRRLWESLRLDPLPQDYDWQLVSKNFARSIRKAVKADPLLREQLSIALQEQIVEQASRMANAAERIAGPTVGFDIAGYRKFLRNRCAGLQLSVLHSSTYVYDRQITLWRIFVAQSARLLIPASGGFNTTLHRIDDQPWSSGATEEQGSDALSDHPRSTVVLPVLEISDRERLLVVLGDPGSGKTSLLNYRALQWVEEGKGALPLRVDFRQYIHERIGLVKWLESGCSSFRLDAKEIDNLLQSGDASLHLDGLDEIFDLPLRNVVLEEIIALASRYPKASIIVTSRTLGYEFDPLGNAGFAHAILEELDAFQISEFLRLWHQVAEADPLEQDRLRIRLQRAIRDSRPIRELAGNPLLLTMMAILNRTQPLPRNRVELYREASRVLVHEWDTRRLLPDDTLDQQDKVKLLRDLSGLMQQSQHGLGGNLIRREALAGIFREFLKDLGVPNPYNKAKALVTRMLPPMPSIVFRTPSQLDRISTTMMFSVPKEQPMQACAPVKLESMETSPPTLTLSPSATFA